MTGLATIALDYLTLIMFGAEDEIDPDYSFKMTSLVPEYLSNLGESERAALSEAAKARMAGIEEFSPNSGKETDVYAFLEIVASGEVFDQCR